MSERPNILFITSDQHRADTLGCEGHPCVRTPHLDQLACEGIRFDRAYADCPVCIPCRTTMITGIKSSTYGAPDYNEHFRIDRERELFLGSLMTRAGYQTGLIGKRHWHTDPSFKAGFETVVPSRRYKREQLLWSGRDGLPFGTGANEINPTLSPFPPRLYGTDWIVDHCIQFIRERETDRPLFLWCSIEEPHPPLAIHEPYYSMYDDSPIPEPAIGDWEDRDDCPVRQLVHRWGYNSGPMTWDELRKARAVYYGMITNMDHQLGRLFGYLMRQGLWENTVVVYASDHGEHLGDHYDVAKSSFHNSAARIPLIVRPAAAGGESFVPGAVSSALVEPADFLPTFCALAGSEPPADIDGQSLLPLIRGESTRVRDALYGCIANQHMIHDGRSKYIYYTDDGAEQLFDHDADPDDLHDLSDDEQRVAPLRKQLIKQLQAIGSPDISGGRLVNHHAERPELRHVKARNALGWKIPGKSLEGEGADV